MTWSLSARPVVSRFVRATALLLPLVALGYGRAAAQTVDPFDPNADGQVAAIAVQPDGKILIGGSFQTVGGVSRPWLARVLPTGALDTAFDAQADNTVTSIAVQPDGKIIVGGYFTSLRGVTRNRIGRLNPDGTLDAAFDPNADSEVTCLALDSTGRILVGGNFQNIGGAARLRIARLSSAGVADTFNPGSDNRPRAIIVQPDSSILVAGSFTHFGISATANRKYIARVDDNGILDSSFDPGASSQIYAMALQRDGRILIGGVFSGVGGGTGTTPRSYIARLLSDGSVDTFDPGANFSVNAIALQADGRINVGGAFFSIGGGGAGSTARQRIARLTSAGVVDNFNPGADGTVLSLVLQPDGRLLVGGSILGLGDTTGTTPRNGLGRIEEELASQSLSLSPDQTIVTWLRGATAPEVSRVVFQSSINGLTWNTLGNGSRVTGGWELTGLTPPVNPNRRLRALGYMDSAGAVGNGSSFVQQIIPGFGTNITVNGAFTTGASGWSIFALPDSTAMGTNIFNGVMQFYRTGTQSLLYQDSGVAVGANVPITAQFRLGNTDTVRKRISILIQDADFTDLHVCTFWLPANAPLLPYTIRTHTTKAWTNARIGFYAASTGAGGFYQLDNVAVYVGAGSTTETTCEDPWTPLPVPGASSGNLLTNGDFSSGLLSPWSTFGQITGAVSNGVFEFVKTAGTPAGVVLQQTGQAVAANEIVTATFQLGSLSARPEPPGVGRTRVTVLVHDNNFADLSACTFWLTPGQALATYTMRMFATMAWTNATVSVYPATIDPDHPFRLDNVTLARTPAANTTGALCIEPGGTVPDVAGPPPPARGVAAAAAPVGPGTGGAWDADGFFPVGGTTSAWVAVTGATRRVLELAEPIDLTAATHAMLSLKSWLVGFGQGTIEVTTDNVTWQVVQRIQPGDTSVELGIDLAAYLGESIRVRFVLEATTPPESGTWFVEDVEIN